ncbi:MAG TPA: penicillin-binding protein 1C [Thermoanaerobaculaceae bacterium]|nr:penicillin-binding protein 1C [Thermoanaerobaculaceae bacterium]HRS16603.1 penicillin-binding protein 1C [Thermoanaerobaculaceae bacterium]
MLVVGLVAVGLGPAPSLGPPPSRSAVAYTDRHGGLLRLNPGADGVRRLPVALDRASPHLVHAVLAAEDRRFFRHPGVDPLALARAAWQDVRARRVVSGGSTLTMQLARLLEPRPRTLRAKLAQIALAVRLERAHDKRAILAAYLSRAPMGNRTEGFEAGARVYLGKPAAQLSPAEAALLAAVPRAPSRDNPWRNLEALRLRRNAILGRMHELGWLDAASLAASQAEPVVLAGDPLRYAAPHFLARVAAETGPLEPGARQVVTTLEPELQARVERIVARHRAELEVSGVRSMAVVVADLERGEWLAWEGSGGFWSAPDGQLDGARALRQPGSALKPFVYAAAFDGGLSGATVLADIPASFTWAAGTWTPRNYDQRFHGPLTARSALACSVNVPAVRALQHVGPQALCNLLRRAGISSLGESAERWGLGLALGAGEVRLAELAAAFGALLRGGEFIRPATWRVVIDAEGRPLRRPEPPAPVRVCSPEAAAQVVDILADPEARAPAFGLWSVLRLPFAAAVKTGTSEGFRDNWCVGGTRDVVVGVWAGNFDRSPMGNVSGVTGAGAVWREVMLAWAELERPGQDLSTQDTLGRSPASLREVEVCALSGLAPSPSCPRVVRELLRPGQEPGQVCDWHVREADGRVAVRWPALYRDWAAGEGLLPPATLIAQAPARQDEVLAVLAPADGDAFVLSPDLPRRFQSLELRCSVPGTPAEVTWLVDGAPLARVSPPYAARWELVPGVHRFEVTATGARSRPVVVSVFGR